MSEKIIKNWVELAEYDFQTAKAMLDSGRYLYVVFTCQQAIEKLLKALVVKVKDETPPYTHNLLKLLDILSISSSAAKEKTRFLELLNSYYIESRYTERLDELAKLLTREKCEEIYRNTKGLFSWLKSKI
jgi:HEPN domain-containing protein